MTTGRINQIAFVSSIEQRRPRPGSERLVQADPRDSAPDTGSKHHCQTAAETQNRSRHQFKHREHTRRIAPIKRREAIMAKNSRTERDRPTRRTQKAPYDRATPHKSQGKSAETTQPARQTTFPLADPRLIERAGTLRDQWSSDRTKAGCSPFEMLTTRAACFGHVTTALRTAVCHQNALFCREAPTLARPRTARRAKGRQ